MSPGFEAFVILTNGEIKVMEHDETGCRPPPEGPRLCINNCGFFGSKSTMYMCSKCHTDMISKQGRNKVGASSTVNIVNGSSSVIEKGFAVASSQSDCLYENTIALPSFPQVSSSAEIMEPKTKTGPNRCSTCKKRVGLTGFECRCGNLYCGSHRYSDKHDCPFDYHAAGQIAIAKANPILKAEKLDKI